MSRHGEKMKTNQRTNNESKQLPAQQIHWLQITVWKTRRPAHNRIKWRNISAEETFLCGVFAQNDSETTCMRCSTSWSWLAVGSADNMHPNHACEWFRTRACKTTLVDVRKWMEVAFALSKSLCVRTFPPRTRHPTVMLRNTTYITCKSQFITPTQILVREGVKHQNCWGTNEGLHFCPCHMQMQNGSTTTKKPAVHHVIQTFHHRETPRA